MNIVQTAEGALNIILDALTSTPTMKIRLFDNNATVNDATVLGDLNEASFPGYSAGAPTWSTPSLVSGVPTTVPSPTNVDFTYSGGSTATVYGAYLTDSAGTKLYGATKFSTPFVFSTVVTLLQLFPTYTQKAEFTTS